MKLNSVESWLYTARMRKTEDNIILGLRLQLEELSETAMALGKDIAIKFKEDLLKAYQSFNVDEAPIKMDKKEVLDGLADQLVVLANTAYYANVPIEDVQVTFDKVMESNWTKYAKTEEEAEVSVIAYSEGIHPDKPGEYIEAYYERNTTDGYYIIKRKSDGKILKSVNYKEPDL